MCFIHLTDIEKDVTPDEVQDFHTLVGNPKWTKNRALRVALAQLRPQYEALWSAYATHALTIGIDPIREHWRATCQAFPPMRLSSIRMAVLEFVRKVHQSSPQTRAKGGATGINDGRRQARTELEALFAHAAGTGRRAPHRRCDAAAADRAPAP